MKREVLQVEVRLSCMFKDDDNRQPSLKSCNVVRMLYMVARNVLWRQTPEHAVIRSNVIAVHTLNGRKTVSEEKN